MSCKTVLASEVAKQFLSVLKSEVSAKESGPVLIGFLANEDEFAKKYASYTRRCCEEIGVKFELRECSKLELEERLDEANYDPLVDGVMIYYPIFGGTQDQYLQNTVAISKDVEGLSHSYRSNMYRNVRFLDENKSQKCIIPCTPLAIIKILEFVGVYNSILEEGNRLHGKTITVINRSEVVGRPLAALMANDGATVISVDLDSTLLFSRGSGLRLKRHQIDETSITLAEALAKSDVVISGVPSEKYKIDTGMLKEGCIAINLSSHKNFEENVGDKASIFVPSVGKVTIAMLIRNLVRLKEQKSKSE